MWSLGVIVVLGLISAVVLPEFSPEGLNQRMQGQTGIGMTMWGGIIGSLLYRRKGKSGYRGFGVGAFYAFAGLLLFYALVLPPLTNGASNAERKLASDPIFGAIKPRDPELFRAIVVAVRKSLLDGKGVDDSYRAAGEIVAAAFKKQLPVADPVAIVSFGRARLGILQEASRKDHRLCQDLIVGKVKARDGALSGVDSATLSELTKAMAEAAISRAGQALPAAGRDVDELLARVDERMQQRWGKAAGLIDQVGNAALDPELACRLTISFQEEILKLPVAQAAAIIRYQSQ